MCTVINVHRQHGEANNKANTWYLHAFMHVCDIIYLNQDTWTIIQNAVSQYMQHVIIMIYINMIQQIQKQHQECNIRARSSKHMRRIIKCSVRIINEMNACACT